jgi:hypothetical protein
LLVIEHVLAPGNAPSWGKMLDLQQLVLSNGGRERSEAEYASLLQSAGFKAVSRYSDVFDSKPDRVDLSLGSGCHGLYQDLYASWRPSQRLDSDRGLGIPQMSGTMRRSGRRL